MAEELTIKGNNRDEIYLSLLPQIKALVEGEEDLIANLSNIAAALKQSFGFFWVGFYLLKDEELVLGPFQGTIACTRIAKGKGVCGTSWEKNETVVVDDVDAFPGHIACSSNSRSEIVVPIYDTKNKFVGVLDVDSDQLNDFSVVDQNHLELLVKEIAHLWK